MFFRSTVIAAFVPFLMALSARADQDDFLIERVAREGDPVECIDGGVWSAVGGSLIDGQGNLLWIGNWMVDEIEHFGYFYGAPGDYQLVLEALTPAPGYDDPNIFIVDVDGPNLAEDGTMMLWVEVDDNLVDYYGTRHVYMGRPGDLDLILYDGGPAPDAPEGTSLLFTPGHDPYVNASGQLAHWDTLHDFITPGDYIDGILAGDPDDLRIVAYGTGPAPDIEGGATFLDGEVPSVGGLGFNDLGWVAFSAWFEGPLVDETNGLGFFVGTPDDLRLAVRLGSQALGMEKGVYFTSFLFEGIDINANGNVAFVGYVDGPSIDETNGIGVWAGPRETPELVHQLRTGEQAPGTSAGTVFTGFLVPQLNNRSELLALGYVDGDDVDATNDQGFWYGPRQDVDLLLRDGQQAPELAEGILVTCDNGEYSSTLYRPEISMNDRGDMVMVAPLVGLVDDSNDRALHYRAADDGNWRLVARTGDLFDGRTLSPEGLVDRTFEWGNGANGVARSFNDDGMLAVFVRFDEGIDGIYRIRRDTFSSKGDSDADGDVDLIDYGAFQRCFGDSAADCIQDFDFDSDDFISLKDYESLLNVRTSPL